MLSESTLLLLFDFVGDDELTGVGKPVIHWVRDDIVQKSSSRTSRAALAHSEFRMCGQTGNWPQGCRDR